MNPGRREFFEKFLAMLVEANLRVTQEHPDFIVGELTSPSEPDEVEEVRWHCAEAQVPSLTSFQLVSHIAERDLLNIDMIPVSRKRLHESFCEHTRSTVPFSEFESALEELLAIEMPRFEDGQEFDAFFVHE